MGTKASCHLNPNDSYTMLLQADCRLGMVGCVELAMSAWSCKWPACQTSHMQSMTLGLLGVMGWEVSRQASRLHTVLILELI